MRLLEIDLSKSSLSLRDIPGWIEDSFVGGRGLNVKLLFEESSGLSDPLSPAYPLFFASGAITDSAFPMAGRFIATSKSPLTGTIMNSACGGRLGLLLKKQGIDVLSIKGKAEIPSYIAVLEGEVEIGDANHLWGREKRFVKGWLKEKYGKDTSVLLVGKAAENGVLFANLENDGRFLGRGGLGTILASKQVKAILIKGGKKPKKHEGLGFIRHEWEKLLRANPITSRALPLFGTSILLNYMRELGLLPSKNFREVAQPSSSSISGEELRRRLLIRRRACAFCPVACGRVTEFGEGPEYETLWALGANLLIHDIRSVARLNALCNEYGLDTITVGAVIGYAIELCEKGKMELTASYGDAEGVERLIHLIAERKGVGEVLSLGTKRMGEVFEDEDAPQVKGLELPAYDPRGSYGQALSYATSNRGGCHLQGYLIGPEILGIPKLIDRFAIEGKGSLVAFYQNVSAFMDTLVLCRFCSFAIPPEYYSRLLSWKQGKRVTFEDTVKVGERIWNLERLFNLREGVEADSLPRRFNTVPLRQMLEEYYEARGWDSSGRPRKAKLEELGLGESTS